MTSWSENIIHICKRAVIKQFKSWWADALLQVIIDGKPIDFVLFVYTHVGPVIQIQTEVYVFVLEWLEFCLQTFKLRYNNPSMHSQSEDELLRNTEVNEKTETSLFALCQNLSLVLIFCITQKAIKVFVSCLAKICNSVVLFNMYCFVFNIETDFFKFSFFLVPNV